MRNLLIVLGDQLDHQSEIFRDADPSKDVVWMAEVTNESTHVSSHKQRIVSFLSSMRHFCEELEGRGFRVNYTKLESASREDEKATLGEQLKCDIETLQPEGVVLMRPGDFRVFGELKATCKAVNVPVTLREDLHFYTTPADFAEHANGRKSLRMEFFYRELRQREKVLMKGKDPVGDAWNFDKENRGAFPKSGPVDPNEGPGHAPDDITTEVMEMVKARFPDNTGSLGSFQWPVTREAALKDLETFVRERLPVFGKYQDAMWTGESWLYHSLISSSLNLKLLNPREVVAAAEKAYHDGHAPLAAVEGFIRQILGWREYVRGIYWNFMPEYLDKNEMGATEPLPEFYWNAETPLACLSDSIGQTLEHAYAHHIQRLMVTGLYALLLGVRPQEVHEWYLAVYIDAVEWVELPNTLGMSQYGDGGLLGSKPYIATGSYINRMSNYCRNCPKNPKKRLGDDACPFTTLYWDYLLRHEDKLRGNNRMSLQIRNLDRIEDSEKQKLQKAAEEIRKNPACR